MAAPRVFTIPAAVPFLPTLLRALDEGRLIPGFPAAGDPLALAEATIYLPTRRACRLARDVTLDALGREAAVLPRIVAIGDIDEDELNFAAAPLTDADLTLPPALSSLDRRLLLARLVLQWASSGELHGSVGAPLVARTPAAALALADDLARLMDDMTTRQVPWDRLDALVPERFDTYWQLSLKFLKIARETWPAILAERGTIEPAVRRDRLIAAEAARLKANPMAPVIAAGSTGSMPSTAALLSTIALLPRGAVVLPGLDTDLDADAWGHIGGAEDAGHPQSAMHALLERLGLARQDVPILGPDAGRRGLLVSEAFRPAATTERWTHRLDRGVVAPAMAGVTVVEAATAEEEALAVAVALRGAVEPPGATAALITADRALSRRVAAALGRWTVAVEQSNGAALTDTPAGLFARLAAEAALARAAPVPLLALLKHPLTRLGAAPEADAAGLSALEGALLRGPRPRAGSHGLSAALAAFRRNRARLHPNDPRVAIDEVALDQAAALIGRLAPALEPLESLRRAPYPFQELAARHRAVVAALGRDDADRVPAFAGDDGAALAEAFEEIGSRPAADDLPVTPDRYPDLFVRALGERMVRHQAVPNARIRILGPLESRLQHFDTVVVGGLVEGSWPPPPRHDPWLSRPMRHALGLDQPERRIGLSAHDFTQALGAPRVILSRPAKLDGVPTVASRFLRRLAAVAGAPAFSEALARGETVLRLARLIDRPAPMPPLAPPAPCPPVEARPTAMTVTDVEHWLRDPYTIYAKHILRVFPLEAVDTAPGARDRGNLIHGTISDFMQTYAGDWPDDPLGSFLTLGRKHFAPLEEDPEARALWWPRLVRLARWFVGWEAARRPRLRRSFAEVRGEIDIALGAGVFRLAARADRIDELIDGRYAILDYKTGEARTEKQVRAGLAPQLTLEAAILRSGGFAGVPHGASIESLVYVSLKGGDPPGIERPIEFIEGTPDSQADRALSRFTALVQRFSTPTQPYR
ncbi:MAG TPA: double-strand break repair protein AddB, partial [Xanthobacteraceae bacterium]|nr:double-strand break repair protein AddB [Xanthobacteraceae bacterium]